MISRRNFVTALSALPMARFLGFGPSKSADVHVARPESGTVDFTKFVKIAIGTGGHGHTYPGATVPFGAVQLSPDTYNNGWDWSSGYHYSYDSMMGVSHTHLRGAGGGDMLDFLLSPATCL